MIVTPLKVHFSDLGIGSSFGDRAPGLHLSDVYNALFKKLEPNRYTGGPLQPARLELGLALESMIEEGIKRRLKAERPGEFETEMRGVPLFFNPDLLIYNGVMRVGEIKYTSMSSKGSPEDEGGVFDPKFDKYFVQLMGYCYALHTQHGRLYAMFANGDYSRPFVPQFRVWDVDFSQNELEENWEMLANFAEEEGMLSPDWVREEQPRAAFS